MTRSNTANGGQTYVDLEFQVVSADDAQYTLRLVMYLTSPNVSDTSNDCAVGGDGYSRGGALGLGGTYNRVPVWYADWSHFRGTGYDRVINGSFTWSGVNFWGTTLSASTSFVVPARYDPPSAPYGYSARNITSSSAYTTAINVASNGGHVLDNIRCQWNTSPTETGSSTVTVGAFSDALMSGLAPGTLYYFRVATANTIYWSAWGEWASFRTLPVVPTMGTSYSAGSITRNSAVISGLSVSATGGEAPSNVRVQYSGVNGDTSGPVVTQGSWANVTIPGLNALTTYYYRVAAYNSAGWSAYGPWKSFTTLADAPNDMAAPTFTSVADNTMRVNWVAPAMNGATFTNYRYEVSLTNTFAVLVQSGTTTNLYVDLVGLTAGTKYYIRVRANATPNNGGYGVSNVTTTGITPGSGMRAYAVIGGVVKQGEIYTFIGGTRYKLRTMAGLSGTVQTE